MKIKILASILIYLMISPILLFSDTDARILYQKGVEAHQKLDRYKAYEYFHGAIKVNPNFVEPIEGLAFLLFEMGQYNQALEYVKRAQELDRFNLNLQNLEGRIYIGLADFDQAEEVFNRVLVIEPNNIEARLGMSDLDVVYGTWKKAIRGYQDILHSYPENIRAMLSLVLIYDEILDEENAEKFIKDAISLYPNDVSVRYLVANHYRKYGKMDVAEDHAKLALQIDPNYRDAALLLAHILLDSNKAEETISVLTPFIQLYPEDFLLCYVLGYAYEKANHPDEAIRMYYRALDIRNSDEFSRHALEQCVINNKKFDDANRNYLANYHFDVGNQYFEQANIPAFFQSYRKGLQISNRDYVGLKGYAEYYKLQGNINKYYSILQELHSIKPDDRNVKDQLNIYKRRIPKTVTQRWHLNPNQLKRDEYKLSFFALDLPYQIIHYDAQKHLLNAFSHVMNGYLNVEQIESDLIHNFADAFQKANQDGSDYFFIFDITEKERSLHIKVDIYFSKSGILLDSFSLLETGNHRLQTILTHIAEKISSSLPLKGNLIRFEFGKGVCNLGMMDGLEVGDELFIIRKGFLNQGTKGFSFDYDDKNVLGTFTVTAVDDLISEGEVRNRFFYDLINEGDHVILIPKTETNFVLGQYIPPDLYKELLKLR